MEKEETLKYINGLYGASSKKTTNKKLHKVGQLAFEELERKLK